MATRGGQRAGSGGAAGRGANQPGPKRSRRGAGRVLRSRPDPSDSPDAETRFIQPYQATRTYLCPGCNGDIPPALGHLVVVPRSDPDLRRHWHRACWVNRANRW